MSEFPAIQPGRYYHRKGEHYYEVLGMALQVETGEPLVIYRPLYDNQYELFARPYSIFTELVEINGVKKPRFEKVDDTLVSL